MITKIYDLDNGAMILRLGTWMHCYNDTDGGGMARLADDIKSYWDNDDISDWDNDDDVNKSELTSLKSYDIYNPNLIRELVIASSCAANRLGICLLGEHAVEVIKDG